MTAPLSLETRMLQLAQKLGHMRVPGGLSPYGSGAAFASGFHQGVERAAREILWELLCVNGPREPDVSQIIHALERAERRLEAEAQALHEQHDYSAEFPAEDAKRMREAVTILQRRIVT